MFWREAAHDDSRYDHVGVVVVEESSDLDESDANGRDLMEEAQAVGERVGALVHSDQKVDAAAFKGLRASRA